MTSTDDYLYVFGKLQIITGFYILRLRLYKMTAHIVFCGQVVFVTPEGWSSK